MTKPLLNWRNWHDKVYEDLLHILVNETKDFPRKKKGSSIDISVDSVTIVNDLADHEFLMEYLLNNISRQKLFDICKSILRLDCYHWKNNFVVGKAKWKDGKWVR